MEHVIYEMRCAQEWYLIRPRGDMHYSRGGQNTIPRALESVRGCETLTHQGGGWIRTHHVIVTTDPPGASAGRRRHGRGRGTRRGRGTWKDVM